ncbi:hypothetical protein V8J82_19680 [Gymnodinialimonas sp. 2305UL16-5]|uniref:hypothetical protein n=1 Tax=Gymnodinialimonas mytili TaxID=3126503 RepID=UPI0030AE5DEA
MTSAPRFLALALFALTACSPGGPELAQRISPEARAQGYPTLLPLDSLLSTAEGELPRDAADEGRDLDARAADLRRRAAWLRSLQL